MTIEIIFGLFGVCFAILVVFLIMTLLKLCKVLKKADRVLVEVQRLIHGISDPSIKLIHNSNKLVTDVQKKSEGLDVLFRPLYGIKKSKKSKGNDKIFGLLECAIEGVQLFSKIKSEMK